MYCDTIVGQCICGMLECCSNDECNVGEFCDCSNGGLCQRVPRFYECRDDSDCKDGEYCSEGECVDDREGEGSRDLTTTSTVVST